MFESYLENLKELILVRLLALPKKNKPGPTKIGKEMYALFQEVCPARNAFDDLMEAAFSQLTTDEQCIERQPFVLKEAGHQRALLYLGVTEVLGNMTWQTLCNRYLIAKVYGLDAESFEVRKQLQDINKLKGCVMNHAYVLDLSGVPTLKQSIHALLWHKMGVATDVEFNEKNLIRYLLELDLNEHSPLDAKSLRDVVIKKEIKAQSNRGYEIRQRILQQLVGKPSDKDQPTAQAHHSSSNLVEVVDEVPDIEAFAEQVQQAAQTSETGWFGERKVFISHVWRNMQKNSVYPKMDFPKFKGLLVEANKQELLTLSRADLVAAMDANDVAESEIQYLNATFHFVKI